MPTISRRASDPVVVITDESPAAVHGLARALAARGLALRLLPAVDVRPPLRGAVYVRRIDPALEDSHRYARAAYLSASPQRTLNGPGAVHIAEWAPLAFRALDQTHVPQPRRIWCFDVDDARRAAQLLGFPANVERVTDGTRARVTNEAELRDAVTELGDRAHGFLLERPIEAEAAYHVMVVDGVAAGTRIEAAPARRHASRVRAAQELAAHAVAAIGGSAMAVEVLADRRGRAYVAGIEPAPALDAFGPGAVAAVADAICSRHRLAAVRSAAAVRPVPAVA